MGGLGAFVEWLLGQGYSDRTRRQYAAEVTRLHRWAETRGVDPAELTGPQLARYAQTRPNTWSTRHLIVSATRCWIRFLGRTDDPTLAVRRGPQPQMRCRALEDPDAERLMRAVLQAAPRERAAALLMMQQALRRQEVAALEWRHVEAFGFREIRIFGKGLTEYVHPLHPLVATALRELRLVTPGGQVFPGENGRVHVTGHTVYKWILRLSDEAGLPRVAPHRLRHTALTVALEATEDLRAVQDFGRHERPETTAKYTRASQRRLDRVVMSVNYLRPRQQDLFDQAV